MFFTVLGAQSSFLKMYAHSAIKTMIKCMHTDCDEKTTDELQILIENTAVPFFPESSFSSGRKDPIHNVFQMTLILELLNIEVIKSRNIYIGEFVIHELL